MCIHQQSKIRNEIKSQRTKLQLFGYWLFGLRSIKADRKGEAVEDRNKNHKKSPIMYFNYSICSLDKANAYGFDVPVCDYQVQAKT